ncbi:phenylalanine--tRNA ligase subunit beta [Candidatus Gottesmanbacteria bacterium]|nr:phenylalanine--tRNA ligase subunit beta [Candidatus Gottesmanbacteria bacterium]
MLIPLSWLKEFVEIKIPFKELAEKLSAAGLTVETWKEIDGDIIFDPEVTPNRPDWMSIIGIAREIAAVTNTSLKRSHLGKVRPFKVRPSQINIKPNFEIIPRMTSVIIKDITVKPSPEWLQKRIKQIGLRPINNLVDITNYVLWLYGSPLHVFDYDKIRGRQMSVELSRGSEDFRSLDGLDYKLPKNVIIIKDVGRVIDLPPLKGGENTAVSVGTKNILLHSIVCDPVLTRRASQALNLRSDSSIIAERGTDPNATIPAVNKALELILDLAGGQAGEILDHKAKDFKSWTIEIHHSRIEEVLGIKISPKEMANIFERLEIKNTIPTFRNDLQIEEDLIEEVGRIYGYNNFPKTLPQSAVPIIPVAYARDYDLEYETKNILKGAGYSEIYSYSLISEDQLFKLGLDPLKCLRVDNPISRDYEYLRPNLLGNLLEALKLNQANFSEIKLFELGKIYQGENIDKAKEQYWLSGIISGESFFEAKGLVEKITGENVSPAETNLNWLHPGRQAIIKNNLGFLGEVHPTILSRFGIKNHAACWAINYDLFEKLANPNKKFQQIPKFPAILEDLSLIIPEKVLYREVVEIIKSSSLIENVELIDLHENSKTLRLTYLNKNKNLTDQEVALERNKILKNLKEKLKVVIKE